MKTYSIPDYMVSVFSGQMRSRNRLALAYRRKASAQPEGAWLRSHYMGQHSQLKAEIWGMLYVLRHAQGRKTAMMRRIEREVRMNQEMKVAA